MPSPTKPNVQEMAFSAAIQAVIDGEKITKLEWNNTEFYGVLRDGRLKLHKPDGFHDWIINDGDLLGKDWIILHNTPIL